MKVVVIGNGIAGFSAASSLRRLNRGCDITIISDEDTPLYSACVLPEYIARRIAREKTFVKREEDYERLDLKPVFGKKVERIEPFAKRVRLQGGASHPYDKLILATGSRAILFGPPKKGVFKLKSLADADAVVRHKGKKAVVVGSGAVGLEAAIALHDRGYQVSVVEAEKRILPLSLDQKGAERVKKALEEAGVEVIVGELASEVLGAKGVEALATQKRELPCDTVIWAIGMRPRVELAQEAGLVVGERGGIVVNAGMETSAPDILACGDCVETNDLLTERASLNLFWHNANRQGAVAAKNCLEAAARYRGSENVLNLDAFGNHVVAFGHTEASLSVSGSAGGDDAAVSVIENEQNGRYCRLVIQGDRCLGAQFINVEQDTGLLWSIMLKKRSIQELLEALENQDLLEQRPWLNRIRPFFKGRLKISTGRTRNGQGASHTS